MYAIIGLGNPERKYENTRHNAGFMVIDELARQIGVDVTVKRHKSVTGIGHIGGEKVILVKPMTYMNLSGDAARAVADFYKLKPENIIVISDDINLDIGNIRVRPKGSAGGHNGLKNIIARLGSQDFVRVRVGVGAGKGDLIKHVLGKFDKREKQMMDDAVVRAASAVEVIILENVDAAMNKFNVKNA